MTQIIKGDFFRLSKSKQGRSLLTTALLISIVFTVLIHQEIRFGIIIFESETNFKSVWDIFELGLAHQKILGIFVAILIASFIGQEYQWHTWQQKWLAGYSRSRIYLSKVLLSITLSVGLFFIFEMTTFLLSGALAITWTGNFWLLLMGGCFIYATLGSTLCLFAMLIKQSFAATLACLGFVMFGEMLLMVVHQLARFSDIIAQIAKWLTKHSLYGMAQTMQGNVSVQDVFSVAVTGMGIMMLTTIIGITIFRHYEL